MSNKKGRFFAFLLLCIFGLSNVSAQTNDESELWLTIAANKDLPKKFDLNSSISFRLPDNVSSLGAANFSLGLSKKIKEVKIGIGYRYSYRFSTYQNRIWAEAKWDKEIIKRTYLDIRTRLQTDFLLDSYTPQNTLRPKFQLSYKIKKTKFYPYLFTELFFDLNRYETKNIRARIGGGIDFKQIENQTIGLGFFKIDGMANEKFKNRNIFTIDYKISF